MRCPACLQGDLIYVEHGDGTGHYKCDMTSFPSDPAMANLKEMVEEAHKQGWDIPIIGLDRRRGILLKAMKTIERAEKGL